MAFWCKWIYLKHFDPRSRDCHGAPDAIAASMAGNRCRSLPSGSFSLTTIHHHPPFCIVRAYLQRRQCFSVKNKVYVSVVHSVIWMGLMDGVHLTNYFQRADHQLSLGFSRETQRWRGVGRMGERGTRGFVKNLIWEIRGSGISISALEKSTGSP